MIINSIFLMIIPIRCFTCGTVIANLWTTYDNRTKRGEDPNKVLDELGFKRFCCRRMFLTHVNYIDVLLMYPNTEISDDEQDEE
jgi:DNA-directed RNA polymerase subunit N